MDIKPCPFCGSNHTETKRDSQRRFYIKCFRRCCRATAPHKETECQAIKAWNTRHNECTSPDPCHWRCDAD